MGALDNRCVNRVVNGASVGAALGASIGATYFDVREVRVICQFWSMSPELIHQRKEADFDLAFADPAAPLTVVLFSQNLSNFLECRHP